jgi:hypothetical protein
MAGRFVSDTEIADRWRAWTPAEAAQRLFGVTAPWCVTAGWALNLFTDAATRDHDDIEIAVPAHRFGETKPFSAPVTRLTFRTAKVNTAGAQA